MGRALPDNERPGEDRPHLHLIDAEVSMMGLSVDDEKLIGLVQKHKREKYGDNDHR